MFLLPISIGTWQELCGVRAVSRYKFYRSRDPDSYRDIPGYKVRGGHWRSVAVGVVSEPDPDSYRDCQGAGL